MGDMGNGSGAFMMGWMVLWGLVALALLALSVAGTVWLIRSAISGDTRTAVGRPPAEELLRSRYAAGEIDEDEFRRRLSSLGG
jgi:putative membrane protein